VFEFKKSIRIPVIHRPSAALCLSDGCPATCCGRACLDSLQHAHGRQRPQWRPAVAPRPSRPPGARRLPLPPTAVLLPSSSLHPACVHRGFERGSARQLSCRAPHVGGCRGPPPRGCRGHPRPGLAPASAAATPWTVAFAARICVNTATTERIQANQQDAMKAEIKKAASTRRRLTALRASAPDNTTAPQPPRAENASQPQAHAPARARALASCVTPSARRGARARRGGRRRGRKGSPRLAEGVAEGVVGKQVPRGIA